nr:hypothetical protein [Tanacetum cinerariifolium]
DYGNHVNNKSRWMMLLFPAHKDVPEIYMQEFWATATVHQHSIRFKMDTRKHIVDLEAFREMLHISPRVLGQSFAEQPFEEEILEFLRNTKAYKEYYACATGEVAPKPKASARRKRGSSASSTTPPTPIATPTLITTVVAAPRLSAAAKGKQPTRATSPTDPSDVERTEAAQLKIVLKRSRHETHISQQGVPVQMKELVLYQGFRMYHLMTQKKKFHRTRPMMKMLMIKLRAAMTMKEEISKIDEQEATESGEGDDEESKSDVESAEEETKEQEEESFDPIPRTPEDGEDDGDGEKDQGLRISEEERMLEEEEADELYYDVDINQGRGLQVSQDIDDSHVTLTPVHSDGQQESSTTTTASQPPTPPTLIPSDILQT